MQVLLVASLQSQSEASDVRQTHTPAHHWGFTATTVLWRGEFSSCFTAVNPLSSMAPAMSRLRYSSSQGSVLLKAT